MFIADYLLTAKRRKQPKCPSMDKKIKKVWYNHTMKYHTAVKRNEVLVLATTWINLRNIMLSERN